MTRVQTFLLATIAAALVILAGNTVFSIRDARAGFSGGNLHPIIGDMAMILFYNDADNCIYRFQTKTSGPAQKISCVTGLN